jgi:hypothetical protein
LLAAADEHARGLASSAQPIDLRAPLEDRLQRFVRARCRMLEASAAMRRSASLLRDASPVVEGALQRLGRLRRREVEKVFAAALGARHGKDRAAMLDALDLVASGAAWDALRRDQRRSPRAAAEVVEYLFFASFQALAAR